jgi:metallo-beta-lactamase family protein
VGFQAKGTIGRKIIEGEKEISLLGKIIPIRAKIYTIGGFSAHADQSELMDWLSAIKGNPEVFLVHGEESVIESFKNFIEERFKFSCYIPDRLSIYELT